MTESTKEELQIEYGDLLQQLENTFDWLDRRKLISKLNAINVLLELPERLAQKSLFEDLNKIYYDKRKRNRRSNYQQAQRTF